MPANLNALIRYKQIDKCLRNKYLKCTIRDLQEKCSEQLAEYRGVYKLISERTIRDDIRIMRSDALGFNAPIEVSDGVYNYSDENYSIFNIEVKDNDLLRLILHIFLSERENIKNKNIDFIIERLKDLTDYELSISAKNDLIKVNAKLEDSSEYTINERSYFDNLSLNLEDNFISKTYLSWKEVFRSF
jgi:hypothetical protein